MSNKLKFIHITKCAGTSIENAGKNVNILWGRFHEEYGYWHKLFPNINEEIIDKYDWFMVVRNPYDRILSEYHCCYGGIGGKHIYHTIEEMNLYIIDKINNRDMDGDHYTEQYKYLHPNKNIHIIKYENLIQEFDNLMLSYNINGIQLKKENYGNRNFNISNFSKELIDLINKVYKKDFELFQYKII
jgi:hypothetical protein